MNTDSKEKKRCEECKKKVGLLGLKCRCGKLYCSSHVTAETHNCSFDYKMLGQQQLSTMMVHVGPVRVEKI